MKRNFLTWVEIRLAVSLSVDTGFLRETRSATNKWIFWPKQLTFRCEAVFFIFWEKFWGCQKLKVKWWAKFEKENKENVQKCSFEGKILVPMEEDDERRTGISIQRVGEQFWKSKWNEELELRGIFGKKTVQDTKWHWCNFFKFADFAMKELKWRSKKLKSAAWAQFARKWWTTSKKSLLSSGFGTEKDIKWRQ